MQTRSLETLVRIQQVQSFSLAADLQNMTLSALSMQMKALETELGAVLFDRSFRPPKLTPLGRRVADQASAVVREQKVITDLCGASDPLAGVYHLGFIQSAGVRILPGFLKRAGSQAKAARFQSHSGLSEHLTQKVALGQIDAAVVTRAGPYQAGLQSDLIITEPMCIAAPASCAGQSHRQIAGKLPFIHFLPSSGIGRLIASALDGFETAGVPTCGTLVLDSLEACLECTKAGLGYTILPRPDILRYQDNQIVMLATLQPDLSRDLVLISRRSGDDARWKEALLSILIAAAH